MENIKLSVEFRLSYFTYNHYSEKSMFEMCITLSNQLDCISEII